jgi:hypothetical protein
VPFVFFVVNFNHKVHKGKTKVYGVEQYIIIHNSRNETKWNDGFTSDNKASNTPVARQHGDISPNNSRTYNKDYTPNKPAHNSEPAGNSNCIRV